jgi:hypothetical protein
MNEFVENNDIPELPDMNAIFGFERPTIIDRAYALARTAETTINIFDGDPEDREKLATDLMEKLNRMNEAKGRQLMISGHVWTHTPDATTFDESGIAHVDRRETFDAEEIIAHSLGYVALHSPDEDKPMVVRHFAMPQPAQISSPDMRGALFQSDLIEIPIDGTAHVRVVGEVQPPHEELLRASLPDLMPKIEEAVKNNLSLDKRLQALAAIDLNEHAVLHDKAGKELRDELIGYINENLKQKFLGLFKITGAKELTMITDKAVMRAEVQKPKKGLVAPINAVRFMPLDNTKLAISTISYVQDTDWYETVFELTPELRVKPNSAININGGPAHDLLFGKKQPIIDLDEE